MPFAARVSGSASFDCQQMQNCQLENLTASTDFLLLRWRVGTDNAGRLQPRYILAKWHLDQVLGEENGLLPQLGQYLDPEEKG